MRRSVIAWALTLTACSASEGRARHADDTPRGSNPELARALDEARAGVTDPTLGAMLSDHWAWRLEHAPVWATRLGVHEWDDRVADSGLAAEGDARRTRDEFIQRAEAIERESLSSTDAVTLALFSEQLQAAASSDVCEFRRWSLSARSNPVAEANGLLEGHPRRNAADLLNLLQRLRGIASGIDVKIENLRVGLAEDRVANAESIRRVVAMTRRQLDQATPEWELMKAARENTLSESEREAFAASLQATLDETLRPALERWTTFLESDLLPHGRGDDRPGLAGVRDGEACYSAMIRRHTTMRLSAQEIHERGIAEMARINAEMRKLGPTVAGSSVLPEILETLRTDPALHFDSEEAVEAFATDALAAAKAEMPRWFGIIPKTDCVVRRIPDYQAPFTTIAYYEPPHPDGSKPGEYYINVFEPKTRPRYEAMVLAVHESIPGHHLQIAIAQELDAVPAFRKHGGHTVFVEGWALYTERLADEMGLYHGDLDRMGVLSFDAWRAGRLVVDTGLHALGWSRQQAVDYLLEHTALAPNNIDNEVDRYITWPGQALAYKLGQLEILELRALAQKALGDRFDIREFHDVVLGAGAVSVAVLRARVDDYLAAKGEGA